MHCDQPSSHQASNHGSGEPRPHTFQKFVWVLTHKSTQARGRANGQPCKMDDSTQPCRTSENCNLWKHVLDIAAQDAEPLPCPSLFEPSNIFDLASIIKRGRNTRVTVQGLFLVPKIRYRQRTNGILPCSTRLAAPQIWILGALGRFAVFGF